MEEQVKSRENSPESVKVPTKYVPPSKDEIMLFGEPEENPLMAKKCEA